MANFTRAQIVDFICNQTGLVHHEVSAVVLMVFDQMVEALARGDTLEFRNFGTFKVKLYKAQMRGNPRKGGSVMSPARAAVKFEAGRVMRQRVLLLTEKMKGEAKA